MNPWAAMVLVLLVGAGSMLAFFLIGDLFHHLPGARHDPEALHRRRHLAAPQDQPSARFQIDGFGEGYYEETPEHVTD